MIGVIDIILNYLEKTFVFLTMSSIHHTFISYIHVSNLVILFF